MNKIVLTKTTSAIFLAIVLVAGTIALSSPSFMIASAQATSDREKDHDDDEKSYGKDRDDDKSRDHDKDYDDEEDKKSYGKDRDRDDKSRDHTDENNEYDYESTKYSDYIDKRYNSHDSEYAMDNDYDKDRYGKDSYESQYSSYGKDNSYSKSKDSSSNSISIKKIKCNNINANLNGIGVNIGATNDNGPVTGPIAEAQALVDDDNEGTDSFVNNDESRQSDTNSNSRIVCINNNENVVTGEDEEPISEICEECFAANSTLQTAILDFLTALDEGFAGFIVVTDDGLTEVLTIGQGTDTIEQLCAIFETSTKLYGFPYSDETIDFVLSIILGVDFETPESGIDALIECLLEAGIIVDRELPPPPPESISADDELRASTHVQCIGDPICAKLEQ